MPRHPRCPCVPPHAASPGPLPRPRSQALRKRLVDLWRATRTCYSHGTGGDAMHDIDSLAGTGAQEAPPNVHDGARDLFANRSHALGATGNEVTDGNHAMTMLMTIERLLSHLGQELKHAQVWPRLLAARRGERDAGVERCSTAGSGAVWKLPP